jgi:hypothetical protein
METSKKTEAYSNTVDRMVGILGKMANMEPLLARGKAHIMADPSGIAKIAFSNLYTPTDSEAKFAADYASLGEDINILRGAFGATGFRSSEAFNQLMNQRGNLLGNPKVFKETLQNSLQSVISQLIPMKKAIEKSGVPMPVTDGILQAYTILNNGDEKKIVAAMKKDGWIGGK